MTGDRQHHESPYPLPLAVDLREYIEALFREKERALDMAAAERDRAAEVLRDEQRRALLVAETEREKAAAALRAGTDRAIADNYARLREQLEAAQKLAESQETHRRELETASEKALAAAFASSEKAVEKAEAAQARVNAGQNEFRAQLKDQASTLMPRKEVEGLLAEQTRQIGDIREAMSVIRTSVAVGPEALGQLQSAASTAAGRKDGIGVSVGAFYGAVFILAAVIGAVIAIVNAVGH